MSKKNRSYISILKSISKNNYIRINTLHKNKLPTKNQNNKINKNKTNLIQALVNSIIEKIPFNLERKYIFIYWKLFFRYTGSNIYGTLTSRNGDVFFALSSGLFPKIKKRKDKTTVFIAKELGEVFSLLLYKYKVKSLIFCPIINHRKVKSLLRFFFNGLHVLCMFPINRIDPIRKVMRNGVRLRKVARK